MLQSELCILNKMNKEVRFNAGECRNDYGGYFIIDDIQLEQNNSSANHTVLKQLAIQSNGKYRFLKDYEKSLNEIALRDDITAIQYEEKKFLSLIDLKWLFGLLIILLALDWFTRRFMGSY